MFYDEKSFYSENDKCGYEEEEKGGRDCDCDCGESKSGSNSGCRRGEKEFIGESVKCCKYYRVCESRFIRAEHDDDCGKKKRCCCCCR